MAEVDFKHPDFERFVKRAQLVDDVCSNRVKEQGVKYLPNPNIVGTPGANGDVQTGLENLVLRNREAQARYKNYLARAVFYAITAHTRRTLVGTAFTKVPELQVPEQLQYVEDDIDGMGNSIYQQSQSVLSGVLTLARWGLYADYPENENVVSIKEQREKNLRAVARSIDGLSIINWKTTKIGAKHYLSLVVFRDDEIEDTDDGFGASRVEQYRALRLIDGVYTVQVWRKVNEGKSGSWDKREYVPKKGDGKSTWNVIPFVFVGAINNDVNVDDSPLYELADLNLAHYRNSADYENSVYFCGQVQPWMSGVDEHHYRMLEREGVQVGSGQLIPVPAGEQFAFAQAEANSMGKEAMDQKEKLMASIGARMLQPGSAVKTATEAQNDNEIEHSVLSLIVSNVSEAYVKVLGWMAEFENVANREDLVYSISQEFTQMRLDPQLLEKLISLVQSGKFPESDFWRLLRKMGAIDPDKDDDAIKEELENMLESAALDLDDDDDVDPDDDEKDAA